MALSAASKVAVLKDYISFLEKVSNKEGKTFVTGSLYLLTEIREQLLK